MCPSWVLKATPSLTFSHNGWSIRNDSWTFESVVSKCGKIGNGIFAYEVELLTDGIIQVGWLNDKCEFDSEAGDGVGDDKYSYSYDGFRQRKWHKSENDVILINFSFQSTLILE